ncbi:MAG: response regulator [Phycisphaerae bacterium]|nr:response regulator [Phycisphaerae bacterium]
MQAARPDAANRLNVLLSEAEQPWAANLPRLLEPQGVRALCARDVDQALQIIEHETIHAAVIDMALPLGRDEPAPAGQTGGLKLLRVIQRLSPTPPAVVVRGRSFDRMDDRLLGQALKLEAFSVLDRPVQLEQMLEVLRRLLKRFYGDAWPGGRLAGE